MATDSLLASIDSRGVARLTLNRPEVSNAINEKLVSAMCDAFGQLSSAAHVRAIVITGAGSSFCVGVDLQMLKRTARASEDENRNDARRIGHLLSSVQNSPKPTIALVNGPATRGGLGLICACDIAVSVDDAHFAFDEVHSGLVAAVAAPFVVDAVGARNARRLLLTGERFSARQAVELGLIQEAAPAHQIDAKIDAILDNIVLGGPNAHRAIKDLVGSIAGRKIDASLLDDVAKRMVQIRTSDEGREGLDAALDNRKPNWVK
ncbi:MAG: enoyl-CoA hydratase-related protein [Pseudomonadota bacterium]